MRIVFKLAASAAALSTFFGLSPCHPLPQAAAVGVAAGRVHVAPLAIGRVNAAPPAAAGMDAAPAKPLFDWDVDIQGKFVLSMARGSDGTVWVGTEGDGVWRRDPAAAPGRRWKQYTTVDGLGDNNAYAVVCDARGRVWVGHLNHGISVFNGERWKNYSAFDGPLGSRVFAMASSPVDGAIWIATETGLTRYSLKNDTWSYLTRADGLPSSGITCMAFAPTGRLYLGTGAEGVAMGVPADGYHHWAHVAGPVRMPNGPSGPGLPSAMINALLVARNGAVYAGTPNGLAMSKDKGYTWTYRRGANWEERVNGLYHGPKPDQSGREVDLLLEDYITCLAEDMEGHIWMGHRQYGVEAMDPKPGWNIYQSGENPANHTPNDDVSCLLLAPGLPVLAGGYGGGVIGLDPAFPVAAPEKGSPHTTAGASSERRFPRPAAPPQSAALRNLASRMEALPTSTHIGEALDEDWDTEGDWVGRCGRQAAVLCGMSSDWDTPWNPAYRVEPGIGPHHTDGVNGVSHLNTAIRNDDPRILYDPTLGFRRYSEWSDGAQGLPQSFEGPNLELLVTLPAGIHAVSLYFLNNDGHFWTNRFQDYMVQIRSSKAADTAVDLARGRVRNFWGGVYQRFLLSGPGEYSIKISKNFSPNAAISGVFIDRMDGRLTAAEAAPAPWIDPKVDGPPAPEKFEGSGPSNAAQALWTALDASWNRPAAAGLQWPYRMLAYRAAAASGAPDSLLAAWRRSLHLWTPADRTDFTQTMAEAWRWLLNNKPKLRRS